ncbi:MAG TPA: quinoprotein relay system zinc metallohydrolase 2 [Steroidobacteraceae bacterium]|jgi:quinoprotein relay system zinc metallohydrolase 2|nr:quinoprotein relay system zinc metallohydrolase 2 [Steroidobacteraceae bacterium]
MHRRDALLGGLSLCCSPALTWAPNADPPPAPLAVERVADGIFFRPGVDEDASAANEGGIANVGFVVGRRAVAVFDPGGSLIDGQRLRAAVRRTTPLPVRYVVLSHGHPDHIFGAQAFAADHAQVVGHQRLPAMLAARGEYYRKRLASAVGADRAGTVVMPTVLVRDRTELDLGGRTLLLTAHPVAHTDNDLTALDSQTGTLLAGDLLFVRRIPSLDGSLRGWLDVLATLKATPARRAVPGHGPTGVDWPGASADLERYLGVLLNETRDAIRKGIPIEEAVDAIGRSERGRWALFDAYHGGNVTHAYKELEWE